MQGNSLIDVFLSGANFTVYQEAKKFAQRLQPGVEELPSYQTMMIGLLSGAAGPLSNAPIDTIKTRVSIHFSASTCLYLLSFFQVYKNLPRHLDLRHFLE